MNKEKKRRVAIIVPGGIGGGYFLQGVPVLEDFVMKISTEFDITVFSMVRIENEYVPKGFLLKSVNAQRGVFNSVRLILTLLIFAREHFRQKFEIVHGVWGYPSGLAAIILGRIFGIPNVISLQGGDATAVPELNYGNLNRPLLRNLTFWIYRNVDCLTALTKFQVNELRRFGFDRKDFQIIPYGAIQARFEYKEKDLDVPFQFLHIANLTKIKDQATLLKCFRIISDKVNAKLTIIGEGELRSGLVALCHQLELQDNVEFVGAVPHSHLNSFFKEAHILLHTSIFEGQGLVAVEAAASGTVVCGTKVGILSDWGDDLCITIEGKDFQSLAEKVLEILKDQSKYEFLRNNAFKWANEHNEVTVVGEFTSIYNRLVS